MIAKKKLLNKRDEEKRKEKENNNKTSFKKVKYVKIATFSDTKKNNLKGN